MGIWYEERRWLKFKSWVVERRKEGLIMDDKNELFIELYYGVREKGFFC